MEFSKFLIVLDYIVMMFLIILTCKNPDLGMVAVAWIAQVGISSGFYFWKAKNENRIKTPFLLFKGLNKEMRDELDMTRIIIAMIKKD